MIKVICYIASIVVQNFTCNHTQFFYLSDPGRRSVTAVHLADTGTGRHMRVEFIQTWNVAEGVPYARSFASFLVGALVLQVIKMQATNLLSYRPPQESTVTAYRYLCIDR